MNNFYAQQKILASVDPNKTRGFGMYYQQVTPEVFAWLLSSSKFVAVKSTH